jgi:asparagine synthetase B (glutamine-hydrolysing)
MKRLQEEQLIPLNKNSGQVKVYLPYLDNRLVLLFSQIPISEKVDSKHRKKIMIQMAKGKIPNEIINRRKYGFCDVLKIKED